MTGGLRGTMLSGAAVLAARRTSMARNLLRVVFGVLAISLVAGCPKKERQEPVYDDGSVKNPGPDRPALVLEEVAPELGDFEVQATQ